MNKYESICFSRDNFGDRLWPMIAQTIEILMQGHYELTMREEEDGHYIIEFNYDRTEGYGNAFPEWITYEELDVLEDHWLNKKELEDKEFFDDMKTVFGEDGPTIINHSPSTSEQMLIDMKRNETYETDKHIRVPRR